MILYHFVVTATIILSREIFALDNGLAKSPPMGWLSWERYRCNIDCKNDPTNCVSERLYMDMADRMAKDGWKEAGYEYVNIDDCWMSRNRTSMGTLAPDPKRFPSGMKSLADFVHSRGLKLGIYEDFGTKTCGGYPGSKDYLKVDAQTFAEWQLDSLKLDGCYSTVEEMTKGYPAMSQYLNQTGRPILYSCSWPAYVNESSKTVELYKTLAKYCNLWRNWADITDSWSSVSKIMQYFVKNQPVMSQAQGPGAWNDPDMLVIGDYGLSYNQQKTQLAVWAMLSAPLYMSNDLRSMPSMSKVLLQNKRVIAVNQDPLGDMGRLVLGSLDGGHVAVLTKRLQPDRVRRRGNYAVLFTAGDTHMPKSWNGTLASLGLTNEKGYSVTEAFSGRSLGRVAPHDAFRVDIQPYDSLLFTCSSLGY